MNYFSSTKKYKDLFFQNTELRQTIFKNTFWLYLGQIISHIARLFIVIYAARKLGVSSYGSFSFAMSFVGLTFFLSDLGINSLYIREFQKKEIDQKKLLSNSLYLKLILIVFSVILTFSLLPFVSDEEARGILTLIIILYSINALRDFFFSMIRAREKMQLETLSLIAGAVATTLLGLLVLMKSPSIQALSYSYIFGGLLSLILLYIFLFKHLKMELRPDWELTKKILSYSWPFAFGAAVGVFLGSLDQVLIGWIRTPEEVAYYSVGLRIIQALFIIPLFLGVAILPTLSRFSNDKEKLSALISRALTFTGMIVLPVLVGGMALSDRIILTLFGQEYSPAVLAFQIQLFLIPLVFFTVIFEHFLLAVNLQIKDVKFTAIASAINLFLGLILIPRFGFNGAAAATLFAQIVNFILTYNLSTRYLGRRTFHASSFVKLAMATVCMFIFIVLVKAIGLSIIYIIPLSAILYFFVLYLMKDQSVLDIMKLFKTNEI